MELAGGERQPGHGRVDPVALLPLTWLTVRRIQAARRESREGFFQGRA